MNTDDVRTEERLRAAARARAALVRDVRPLELPAEAPRRVRGAARTWGGWLGPVAAAAVVVAIALTLVLVRQAAAPVAPAAPAPPAASPLPAAPAAVLAKVPRYYAVISKDGSTQAFSIVDDRTGRSVYSTDAPGPSVLDGVSVSSDDKTFILTFRMIVGHSTQWTVWKIHLAANPLDQPSIAEIKVNGVGSAQHLDAWLSPGGDEVIVRAEQVSGTTVRVTVQSYHASQSSPGPLRAWTAVVPGGTPVASLSWGANNQTVVYSEPFFSATAGQPSTYNRVSALTTTAPSGDLIQASHVVFTGPPSCATARLTPDGATAVCGTRVTAGGGASGCDNGGLGFAAYTLPAGPHPRALASYPYPCEAGTATALWADTGATDVVGLFSVTSHGSTRALLGVAAGGQLYGLPLPYTPLAGDTSIAF